VQIIRGKALYGEQEVRKVVNSHGHLWFVNEVIRSYTRDNHDGLRWYWCKSLATGAVYDWREDEFETAKEDQ
jgi:hypothetical protein